MSKKVRRWFRRKGDGKAAVRRRRLLFEQVERRRLLAAMWDGGGSDDFWSTSENWVGDVAPLPNESLTFPDGAARVANVNDFASGTVFDSIIFSGAGYDISGNPIGLSNGVDASTATGFNDLGVDVSLQAAQSFTVGSGSATLNLGGNVDNAGFELTVDGGNANVRFDGVISGAGGLTMNASNGLQLQQANLYTGVTTLNSGVAVLSSDQALGSPAGGTVIDSGAAVSVQTNYLTAEPLTVNGNGPSGLGSLGMQAGRVFAGPIVLGSDSEFISFSSSSTATLTGSIDTNGNQLKVIGTGSLRLEGAISGTGSLFKDGSGRLTLTAANSYSGTTFASQGRLRITNADALGSSAAGTTMTNGTALELEGGITVTGESLTLDGQGVGATGGLRSVSGNNTWAGEIVVGTTTTQSGIGVDVGRLVVSGVVRSDTSTGGLAKWGAGELVLSGANTYPATTSIVDGILQASSLTALGSPLGDTNLLGGGTLRLSADSAEPLMVSDGATLIADDGVSQSGAIRLSSNAEAVFGTFSPTGTFTLAAPITGSGGTTGGITLDQGTIVLNADNTYTGPMTVTAGELVVNGDVASNVFINSGATLRGTSAATDRISGTVVVNSGGTLAPGNSPGILNTSDFNSFAGAQFEFELGGTNAGSGPDDHDQLNVQGLVNLSGDLNVSVDGDFVPSLNDEFIIIVNDGTSDVVSGTFTGLADGAIFVADGYTFEVNYDGGDGNDVALTVVGFGPIPVTTTADSGPGSLRQAILDANATPGVDTIEFEIAGSGPHTIQPLSALPTISGRVVIDGTTEPDYAGTPIVEIDGTFAGSSVNGLRLGGDDSVVRGLVINRFTGNGILVDGGDRNIIEGNYIGTNVSGTADFGNGLYGVEVRFGSVGTRIGTDGNDDPGNAAERNVISGNNFGGVLVRDQGTDATVIAGNYIGTNADGTAAVGNNGVSIGVYNGPDNTRIGTDGNGIADTDERNVISGNRYELLIVGVETDGTVIAGNYIGTNAAGNAAIPNSIGITLRYGPQNTRIGTDGSDDPFNENERNVISGNNAFGIRLQTPEWFGPMPPGGATLEGTVIAGNYIGTDESGTQVLGNGNDGIYAHSMPANVRIGTDGNGLHDDLEGNVISSNGDNGIQVDGWTTMYLATIDAMINGELPATTFTQTIDQADLFDPSRGAGGNWSFNNPMPGPGGDVYAFQATGTLTVDTAGWFKFAVGGDDGGRLRVEEVVGSGTFTTVINDDTGHGFRDEFGSIFLTAGDHQFEWVGFERSGDAGFELAVADGSAPDFVSTANGWTVVGEDASPLPIGLNGSITVNALYPDPGDLNLTIAGNYIGTDKDGGDLTGTRAFGNGNSGIYLLNHAEGVTIGTNGDGDGAAQQEGDVDGDIAERNIISGNGFTGIRLEGQSTDNIIAGNYIGTDVTGTVSIGNGRSAGAGIWVGNAHTNIIGTNGDGMGDENEGNLISGNDGYNGIFLVSAAANDNRVAGNLIGTDHTGTLPLANRGTGVEIKDGASRNLIGTNSDGQSDELERNVISGNTSRGVWMWIQFGGVPQDNIVAGNYIGTDITGEFDLGNSGQGVLISHGASNNIVGTNGDDIRDSGERNIISGNNFRGVEVSGAGTDSNKISGNYFGTDKDGETQIQNLHQNVRVSGGATNTIVGTDGDGQGDADEGNVIASSQFVGVIVANATTTGTVVAGNLIGLDATGTVAFGNGAGGNGGVRITAGASFNRVGTNSDGTSDDLERNVVSANNGPGIQIDGNGSSNNTVAGNYVGLDITGMTAIGNTRSGIAVQNGASNNKIGGTALADRNVTSGNIRNGIELTGSNTVSNWVLGNFVGTNALGTLAVPNGYDGITVLRGASNNIIGTNGDGDEDEFEWNLIAGNRGDGVSLDDSGTMSGGLTAADGLISGAVPSTTFSRSIPQADLFDPESAYVGNAPFDHVIPGGGGDGYAFRATGTIAVSVPGTYTFSLSSDDGGRLSVMSAGGTAVVEDNVFSAFSDTLGEVMLGVGNHSIEWIGFEGGIESGFELSVSLNNFTNTPELVGPSTDPSGWKILGDPSPHAEISLVGSMTVTAYYTFGSGLPMNNIVAGNYIGTNADGNPNIGNEGAGVKILRGASSNLIGADGIGPSDSLERNIISGNAGDGIHISAANNNTVAGNYIGTNADGDQALANAANGVSITLGASGNTIGGSLATGNLISGNTLNGVVLSNSNTNTLAGNYIGTDFTGNASLPNVQNGVFVTTGAGDNTIGGAVGLRNVISGNVNGAGVAIDGTASENWIAANYIGIGEDGATDVANKKGVTINNASNQRIGTNSDQLNDAAEFNVVTGNTQVGIELAGSSETNRIAGNRVGTDPEGMTLVGSQNFGVRLGGNSQNNWVGTDGNGTADGNERNVIAGAQGHEVELLGAGVTNNRVAGNYIGIAIDGSTVIQNGDIGVKIGAGASGNFIGTDVGSVGDLGGNSLEGNVIGGMTQMGVQITASDGNVIAGNLIGTDSSGMSPAINNVGTPAVGIRVESGASINMIGGAAVDARNIISGNPSYGVEIVGADNNSIRGNYIGLDINGTSALANESDGIFVNGSDGTEIGGAGSAGNVVSGNLGNGIHIGGGSTNTQIDGNVIGSDAFVTFDRGNSLDGILVDDSDGTEVGLIAANTIAFNANGVAVTGNSQNTTIRGNSINANAGLGIDLGGDGATANDPGDGDVGPNDFQNSPTITNAFAGATTVVLGDLSDFATGVYELDFFASSIDGTGGKRYLGSLTHDIAMDGTTFTINGTSASPLSVSLDGEFITATATSSTGNTSEFSAAMEAVLPAGVSPTVDQDSLVVTLINEQTDDGAPEGFLLNDFGKQTRIIPEGKRFRLDGLFSGAEPDETHTVTIDFGDGTTRSEMYAPLVNGFSFEHAYEDDLSALFTLTSASPNLTVDGILLSIAENAGVAQVIDGDQFTISDGSTIKSFELDSDGLVSPGSVVIPFSFTDVVSTVADSIAAAIAAEFPSASPANLGLETGADAVVRANVTVFARVITVTVSDGIGSGATNIGVAVQNVAPSFDTDGDGIDEPLRLSEAAAPNVLITSTDEGTLVILEGNFVDPGLDPLTVEVHWNKDDPTALVQSTTLAAGTTSFNLDHLYTDDMASATIEVRVTDGDGGEAIASTSLRVDNVAPTAVISGPSTGVEGTEIAMGTSVTDPGDDEFTYVWDVRRGGMSVASGNGSTFNFTPADQGNYAVTLVVTDDDGGTVADLGATPPIFTASKMISVANAAPQIDVANPLEVVFGGSTVTSVPEGSEVSLQGIFADLGLLDSHQITIDWGDNSSSITYDAGTFVGDPFSLAGVTHTYLDDNPTDTPADDYTITVDIVDGSHVGGVFVPDGGILSLSRTLTVTNVDPKVKISDAGSDDNKIRLRANVEDPGGIFSEFSDTHSFVWNASFLESDGTTRVDISVVTPDPSKPQEIEFDRPTALLISVGVTVTDDDGGVGTNSSTFVGGSSEPDTISVVDSGTGDVTVSVGLTSGGTPVTATFDPGDQLIIASGGGNDVLQVDTSITTSLNVDLGDGDDSVVAGSGSDVLNGGAGNDTIVGMDGDDTLISSGDDQLEGGDDSDTYIFVTFSDKVLIETGGDDTLDFSQIPQGTGSADGVSLDTSIDDGTAQGVYTSEDSNSQLKVSSISLKGEFENILGSKFNDRFSAGGDDDTTANRFSGGGGDDSISTGGGGDTIDGGDGNDSIFGGAGDDTIDAGGNDDMLDGGDGNDSIFGGDGNDTIDSGGDDDMLNGGEGNDSIFGGDGADTIDGGGGSDMLDPGDGNDSIFGGGGDDTIDGGLGNDQLSGGTGDDSIFGGAGDATIDGGDGNDTIVGSDGNDSIMGGQGNDKISVSGADGSDSGNDSIFGGIGDDTIIGDGGDMLSGGEGNDSLFGGGDETIDGGGGNDTIVSGDGNDSIFGGEGDDSIDAGRDDSVLGGGGSSGDDSIFGGGGDDTISGGGDGRDTLSGGVGNDSIFGGSGDETLSGGDGQDTIVGGQGNDSIFGGAGDDSISTGEDPSSSSGHDSVFGGAGDDTITGGGGGNTLSGGDGNDSIFGGGDETIDGGRGDDTIVGGEGSDSIFGGAGNDSISIGGDPFAGGGDDSVFGGDGDDTIIGDSDGRDTLSGGDGNDSIFGGGDETIDGGRGNDTIVAGQGSDSIFGGLGDDSIDLGGEDTTDSGDDSVFGGAGDDTIRGDGDGGDTLSGGDGNDSIFGGGDETIDGGGGNDTIIGGDGADSIFGGLGDDSIEVGGDDTIDSGDDSVFGGAGDDTISGDSDGADTLSGGDGNDSIFGGGGDETILGGEGNDTLIGNAGDDSIFGGAGDDSIDAGVDDEIGSGNDSVFGGIGDDTISGDGDGNDTLSGGEGDDSIFGGYGDETIDGGDGSDTLGGGQGNDSIFGGIDSGVIDTDVVLSIADSDMRLTSTSLVHDQDSTGEFTFTLSGIEQAALFGGASANRIDASEFSGGALLSGGHGNDTLIGGVGSDSLEGGAGDDSLIGGSGADVYLLSGENLGQDQIVENPNNHGDQIDLFGFNAGTGVSIDLSSDAPQILQIDPATGQPLSSVQWSSNSLEGAVGTVYADVIDGSDFADTLSGGGGLDSISGGSGDDMIFAGVQRYVYLDFDSATEPGEHVYTSEERDLVQAQMEQDYALFDVVISQDLAEVQSTGQPFITVRFNDAPVINGVPSPGGVSQRIGWRLTERGGTVKVSVNGFFGDGSNQLPEDNDVIDDNVLANVVALSTTIASHELAHMYGLRHGDSFGAPGQGIFAGLRQTAFLPSFEGDRLATSAADHLLASPASIGSSLVDAIANPFFGEREAAKLAFGETGQTVRESDLATIPFGIAEAHLLGTDGDLPGLGVPNTIEDPNSPNFGIDFDVSATNVTGRIELTEKLDDKGAVVLDASGLPVMVSESDVYAFQGSAGDVVTMEVLSFTLRHRLADRIDSLLRVYDASGNKLQYHDPRSPGDAKFLGAFNDDGFEGSDSILIDLKLPHDGIYYVEVDTFSFINLPELPVYSPLSQAVIKQVIANNPNADSVRDTDTGDYELFIYRFNTGTVNVAAGDVIAGGAGADTLVGSSGNDIYFADAEDTIVDDSPNPIIGPAFEAGGGEVLTEGDTLQRTIAISDRDSSIWTVSVDYGDDQTIPQEFTVTDQSPGAGSFQLSHVYPQDGSFQVAVTIDDGTTKSTDTFTVDVQNFVPIVDAGEDGITRFERFQRSGSFTDPGADLWTGTVDYGDGSPEQSLFFEPDKTFVLDHDYPDTGEVSRTYPVTVTIDDGSGVLGLDSFLVEVIFNSPPVADAGGPYEITEGDLLTLDGSGSSDPEGPADIVSFQWDLNDDGIFDAIGKTPQFNWTELNALGIDNDGTFDVTLVVTDTFAESSSDDIALTVINAPPRIDSLVSSNPDLDNKSDDGIVSILGTFFDAGVPDTHTVQIDWGDERPVESFPANAVNVGDDEFTHAYQEGGIFTITVVIVDDSGDASMAATTTAVVTGVGEVYGTLYVIGTDQVDDVEVRVVGAGDGENDPIIRVKTKLGNDEESGQKFDFFDLADVSRIEIHLCAGDDSANLGGGVGGGTEIPSRIFGGEGDDYLVGGNGRDLLLGGAGTDRLFGRKGSDVLSGGEGEDVVLGDDGFDLIIGGDGADDLKGGKDSNLILTGIASGENDVAALDVALDQWLAEDSDAAVDSLGLLSDDGDVDWVWEGGGENQLLGNENDKLKP